MALTPVEIRHLKPARGFLGYKRAVVDRLLVEIAESYGDVWRDRADLTDKIEQLELDLVRHKELEGLLRTTLVSAESAAQQLREQARKEAEGVVAEAHAEARAISRRASAEKERLETRAPADQVAAALGTRQPRRGGPRRPRACGRVHRRDPAHDFVADERRLVS